MSEFPREILTQWDRDHLWHPFTAQKDWVNSPPLIIVAGEGNDLIDSEGRHYLDVVGSLWCNVHGHRHPTIDAAIRDQLDEIAHSTLLGLTHPTAIELARKLAEIAPAGLTRVFFAGDGASAVEAALKMAFQYWQQKANPEPNRTKFLALGSAYHGDTIGSVSVGGVDRFHAMFSPLLFQAFRAPTPDCYRCPLGLQRPECGIACVEEVGRILSEHPGEVAAVIVEARVQGAAGMIVQPPGYLRRLREITRDHDTLLIADEVAVGFGKTGSMFACATEGVSPDLLALGKGLTGGYLAMAATLATEEVYSAFFATAAEDKTFQHGHTYAGNPLAAAAALANLRVFEEENTLANLPPKIELLSRRLGELLLMDHVGDVRQCGLIAGVELVADADTGKPFPASLQIGRKVCRMAQTEGLMIRPLGDVLVFMPPLSITQEQINFAFDVLAHSIPKVIAQEFPR